LLIRRIITQSSIAEAASWFCYLGRMEILRTPDERFRDLPGYAFEPHYVDADGVRMHHVDEGRGRDQCCCSTASRRGATSTAR